MGAAYASAQTFDPISTGVINQQVSATVNPENPTPGQNVTISLTAYGTDLSAATISWSVNGTQSQRGTGVTQFTLIAGKNGEAKNVTATISPTNGPSITKTFSIAPQDVSIIYEADGFVPAFYKGKAAYAKEGTLTLVAIPNLVVNGTRLSPSALNYKWIVDETVQGSKSGFGKNSFTYTGSILDIETFVRVEVSSAGGATKGSATILLAPQNAQVLVYEQNPVYGIMMNKELSSNGFSLNGKETTVSAIPFSTSVSSLNDGTLSYTWTINGDTIPVPKSQSYATFRNSTGEQGTSLVGVSVNNSTHLLQMMRNSLSINF